MFENWTLNKLTLSQTTNFFCPKTKEFAGNNFRFDENPKNFSKQVENTVVKVFSKDLYCKQVKKQGLFGKGLREVDEVSMTTEYKIWTKWFAHCSKYTCRSMQMQWDEK